MIVHTVEIDREMGLALATDPDLSLTDVGILFKLQYADHFSGYNELGVNTSSMLNLVRAGWLKVRAHYQTHTRYGRQYWQRDEVTMLRKKDSKLSIWAITYRRHKSRKEHRALVSAHDKPEAVEEWRHAWPSHELVEAINLDLMTMEEWEEMAGEWLLPQGVVAIPLRFQGVKRRNFETYADKEFFEHSKLTEET